MIGTDPTTGLPAFGADQVIEQIPLGQMVFPFADLDASARMRRQPIYGDDIIPTSSLVTGQDINGTARAATMDTSRRLYTRDAQLQSNGAPLKDGTTGPIDVNIAGSSGGGIPGNPYVMNGGLLGHGTYGNSQSFDFTGGISQGGDESYNIRYLTGLQLTHSLSNTTLAANDTSYWTLFAQSDKNPLPATKQIYLYQFQWSNFSNANTYAQPNGNAVIMFNPAIDMFTSLGVNSGFYLYLFVSPSDSGSFYVSFWGHE
jgi:hypothetical protein